MSGIVDHMRRSLSVHRLGSSWSRGLCDYVCKRCGHAVKASEVFDMADLEKIAGADAGHFDDKQWHTDQSPGSLTRSPWPCGPLRHWDEGDSVHYWLIHGNWGPEPKKRRKA